MKLDIQRKSLPFDQALSSLKAGEYIKVPEWSGYWKSEDGKILYVTSIAEIEVAPDALSKYVFREDWQVVSIDISDMLKQFRDAPVQFVSELNQVFDQSRYNVSVQFMISVREYINGDNTTENNKSYIMSNIAEYLVRCST